ncbi:MAG TPA: hypothetical protein VGY66_13425, partial [Gemmataceae bacterium]|nr:hypothetical protein [Gemmataceae bacterium]
SAAFASASRRDIASIFRSSGNPALRQKRDNHVESCYRGGKGLKVTSDQLADNHQAQAEGTTDHSTNRKGNWSSVQARAGNHDSQPEEKQTPNVIRRLGHPSPDLNHGDDGRHEDKQPHNAELRLSKPLIEGFARLLSPRGHSPILASAGWLMARS